jgi:hypothetical protein
MERGCVEGQPQHTEKQTAAILSRGVLEPTALLRLAFSTPALRCARSSPKMPREKKFAFRRQTWHSIGDMRLEIRRSRQPMDAGLAAQDEQ